jgi:predicted dithiol-disulfide oxidoreductase (DUF899 family)
MNIDTTLNYPRVASRAEWLQARRQLLAEEKKFTQERDRLNIRRRELPMVRVDQDYAFEGPEGRLRLVDLFKGRPQLLVYHFMWRWQQGQPLDEPCRGCSGWADEIARGHLSQLHRRNTELALISRAPMAKITPFKQRMGWKLPWYSSAGNNFNFDFHVSFDERVAPIEYNYRTKAEHVAAGTGGYVEGEQPFDMPGFSCFLRKGDEVFHTYSTYARGTESAGGSYHLLDLTALGRQEDWELPKGRAAGGGLPPRPDLSPYPDEYPE